MASKKMKEGEDDGTEVRKWEDLDQDLLIKIFSKIDQDELLLDVSSVCLPWNSAVCELLFKGEPGTLNLTPIQRVNFGAFEYHMKPKVLMSILVKVMKSYSFDGNDGFSSITKMVFPSRVCVLDRHLVYLAQRSNKLKRLFLAAPEELTGKGFSRAIRNWHGIEEMLLGPLDQVHLEHIIKEIGINCKNLEVLYLDHFWLNGFSAPVIAENLRRLTVVNFHEVFYSDSGLQVLLSKCAKLWKLELINCARFVKCGAMLSSFHPSYIRTLRIKRIQDYNSIKWSIDGEQENYTPKEMVLLLQRRI